MIPSRAHVAVKQCFLRIIRLSWTQRRLSFFSEMITPACPYKVTQRLLLFSEHPGQDMIRPPWRYTPSQMTKFFHLSVFNKMGIQYIQYIQLCRHRLRALKSEIQKCWLKTTGINFNSKLQNLVLCN